MCRLFGLTAGEARIRATFWLLDAPDSVEVQSHRNADGTGLGYFGADGEVVLDKQPVAAFRDQEFARAARAAQSSAFVAHVRWATTGGKTERNTHPFGMNGRVMGHNGGFGSLARLDTELGPYARLVRGETDSERYFALITKETDARGGDVAAGIAAAASWIGRHLPLSSLNAVVAAPGELWALRYPDAHALHVLERPAGGGLHVPERPAGGGLHVRSSTSSVHAPDLADAASVVVASEAMDGESGWRMLEAGELVHVRADLSVESRIAVPEPPAHLVPLPPGNPNIDT